jgi:hypothetical protein
MRPPACVSPARVSAALMSPVRVFRIRAFLALRALLVALALP